MNERSNIPYIRIWCHLFDYQTTTKRKEFIIDFLIHVALTALLYLVTLLFDNWLIKTFYTLILVVFFLLPYLSLTGRRIKDTGVSPYLSLISLTGAYGLVANFIVCLFKSEEDQKNKSKKKYFFAYFIPGLLVILFFLGLTVYLVVYFYVDIINHKDNDIANYETKKEEVANASLFLPSLSNFDGLDCDIEYGYKEVSFIFVQETIALSVEFENENDFTFRYYNDLFRYEFHESEVTTTDGDYVIPLTSFTYEGFTYQFVKRNKQIGDVEYNQYLFDLEGIDGTEMYCKSFMLYGINEEEHTIRYLYFYDYDLDYISIANTSEKERQEDMIRYIESYFYLDD